MKIGIIGAGFTGLTAGLILQKKGHQITILEKESVPGGLAVGFRAPGWDWSLEKFYHHIFTTDHYIRRLGDEVGVKFDFRRPNTSSLIDEEILQIDSPATVLFFPKLSMIERLRMGMVIGYLKYLASWERLEKYTIADWLPKMMGRHAYRILWEPLLMAKFSQYANEISLAWFWARVKARSTSLGYPRGGFQHLADSTAAKIGNMGGQIFYNLAVSQILQANNQLIVHCQDGQTYYFDKVIFTLSNAALVKIAPQLPTDYKEKLLSYRGIGAISMVLEFKKPFFRNQVYWLNICNDNYPFLAAVEQTNMIDKTHYHNHHLLYIANYLVPTHRYFQMTDSELLQEYHPFLNKLHNGYQKNLLKYFVFKAPFAQPIMPVNYSQRVLPHQTPLKNVYLANMQQVYPWDRGTNYAVELGEKVSVTLAGDK